MGKLCEFEIPCFRFQCIPPVEAQLSGLQLVEGGDKFGLPEKKRSRKKMLKNWPSPDIIFDFTRGFPFQSVAVGDVGSIGESRRQAEDRYIRFAGSIRYWPHTLGRDYRHRFHPHPR